MLHLYAFSNFQSFRDRAEVSLLLNQKSPFRGWEVKSAGGLRVSTALAVVGANGAGKTAALKPLAFAAWFLSQSFLLPPDALIPVTLHFADADSLCEIEVEAEDDDGVVWRYVLRVTPQRVVHEALYRKRDRFNYVFVRDWVPASERYTIKQQGFGFAPSEARKVRPNASLVSTAAQYGVELARHVISFHLESNVTVLGRAGFHPNYIGAAAQRYADNPALQQQMTDLLVRWDLGLNDVRIREVDVAQRDGATERAWLTFGTHRTKDGATVELPMELESSGTQSAFLLLSRLLSVLSTGGVAVIDELENDLHPQMVEPILDLFANPTTNPKNAQIVFTCHTPDVLDLLQKAQVVFVEKNDCESVAYRGDSIQGLRSDDNLRAKYMAGALGAVPRV